MTKSRGDDVFLTDGQYWCFPMAITGRLPMALEGSAGVADWSAAVFRSVTKLWFYVFLSYLNSFCIRILFNLEFES